MTFSFVKESVNNQTPDETLLVLIYEVKNIALNNFNLNRFGSGYREGSRVDIGDSISMLRMLCEQLKIDYENLPDLHSFMSDTANLSNQDIIAKLWISIGSAINCYHYIKRFGSSKQHGRIETYLGMFKYLLRKYCDYFDFEFEVLQQEGEEHYMERMKQLKEQGLKEQLKKEYR